MKAGYERTRLLITVMTYPHPSEGYQELVCTAGVTADLRWIRLYPVDYRYRSPHQRFSKYQWIEVDLAGGGHRNDNRPESRRPDLDSIAVLGGPLSTDDAWRARREVIDCLPRHTLDELKGLYESERISLGVVRPARVLDLIVKKADTRWKPKWEQLFRQGRLFGDPQKPLAKIPYTFHYIFECSGKRHTAMNEDWEVGVLFLKERQRLGSDEAAAKSVRRRFLEVVCGRGRDTRFFMGTRWPYNTWMVLGVFWPPRMQPELPGLFA